MPIYDIHFGSIGFILCEVVTREQQLALVAAKKAKPLEHPKDPVTKPPPRQRAARKRPAAAAEAALEVGDAPVVDEDALWGEPETEKGGVEEEGSKEESEEEEAVEEGEQEEEEEEEEPPRNAKGCLLLGQRLLSLRPKVKQRQRHAVHAATPSPSEVRRKQTRKFQRAGLSLQRKPSRSASPPHANQKDSMPWWRPTIGFFATS